MVTPSKYYAIKEKYHKCSCDEIYTEWVSKEFKDAGISLFRCGGCVECECIACKFKRVRR